MFCQSCGTENMDDAKFCGQCGRNIGGQAVSSDNNEAVVVENNSTVTQESKNLSMLVWIGTLILGLIPALFLLSFIPSLIFYLSKKDDPYILSHAKEALNWSITAVISFIVGGILMIIFIGSLVILAAWICNLVFCIMGIVAATNGRSFKVPFALRLIQ